MIIELTEEEREILIRVCHRARRLHEIMKDKNDISLRNYDINMIVSLMDKFKDLSNDH